MGMCERDDSGKRSFESLPPFPVLASPVPDPARHVAFERSENAEVSTASRNDGDSRLPRANCQRGEDGETPCERFAGGIDVRMRPVQHALPCPASKRLGARSRQGADRLNWDKALFPNGWRRMNESRGVSIANSTPGNRKVEYLARLRLGPTGRVRSHPAALQLPACRTGAGLARFILATPLQA